MASKETNPDSLAKKTFAITMVGVLLYVTIVFIFVIGGNRREEAKQVNGAHTPTLQAGNDD
jgi:hypothetical protein